MQLTINTSKLQDKAMKEDKQAVKDYATEKITAALTIFDVEPVTADIRLYSEGATHDMVQKVDIRANINGNTVVQSSHSRDIYRSIDRAAVDLKRQVKKLKTRLIDGRRQDAFSWKQEERQEIEENEGIEASLSA